MRFFFSKPLGFEDLGEAEYLRCADCGFVISRTHAEMSAAQWERLNEAHHRSYQGGDTDPGDPRWRARLDNQAAVLSDAAELKLVPNRLAWLDYACGDGKLSEQLLAISGRRLLKYDRYMGGGADYLSDADLVPGGFDLVITTSVFEHLMRRDQFDAIESLVSQSGVLGIHTLVCEDVPQDPSWFYLAPVHCAFHTNRSMERLFRQWGYSCSVYNVAAQLWLWFKQPADRVEALVQQANRRAACSSYVFKTGFVDYWKGSPIQRQAASQPG
jgi:hypothetical protein